MIVISRDLVLAPPAMPADVNADNPLIGWQNIVSVDTVSATQEDPDFPVANLANPSTAPRQAWRGVDLDPFTIELTIETTEEIDYVALAGHNLAGRTVTVEGTIGDEVGSPPEQEWFELVQETMLISNEPMLFRFVPQSLSGLRLVVSAGLAVPRLAVMYCGALLVLQRRIYVGHQPGPLNRKTDRSVGVSEKGNFLGRVIRSQSTATAIEQRNLTPEWYRETFEPFAKFADQNPFFWAWRPGSYPREVGFVWTVGDISPANEQPNGMMGVSIDVEGIFE
ncbi:hypothetical protein SAMN04488061_2884 [Filomicrobium insigne]|uniref:Uncharacterized protein n=1 Tax=Filomicrobium insigne TaxID=418854 RepID=A0A1H0SG81_9HYPH|nr:hypothetical protein [Filomicrobium insigne]SDP40734.1 hypothetical protein SAMN04488061_2884 [Filomicrobium insigne]